jgi:deazaflavin-dependent oxidoreductase (nitroreductase family)
MKHLLKMAKWLLIGALAYQALVRLVRHFVKFPIPHFLANAIDNPLRRRAQPPEEMPRRLGLRPGMIVLEIGPGNGHYTLEHARYVGPEGRVVALDIAPEIVARVQARAAAEGVSNLEAQVGDVHALPFDDATFDAVVLITVIGELPNPDHALTEFFRVLKPGGTVGFGELLADPDFPLAPRLARRAERVGFRLKRFRGGFWQFTLVVEKPADPAIAAPPAAVFDFVPRNILRLMNRGPQIAYRLGLGSLLGRMVLLLTTTGRRSGLPRVTPLQYELIEGAYYVASMRGLSADWVRNLRTDPRASVQVAERCFSATAEIVTESARVADFLRFRLGRHPRLVGAILRSEGLALPPSRADLQAYAAGRTLVMLDPERPEA